MKYKLVSKERCRQVFELYREKRRCTNISLTRFCAQHKISYWVMRRWMRNNNESVRQARTGVPARSLVRMPDMGIGFFCIDMEGDIPYRLVFRILPFDEVKRIGKALLAMNICTACNINTDTDSYRSEYVAERIELKMENYFCEGGIDYLARLCKEAASAGDYELYELPVNELINLKVKTAFNKRKRYI